MLRSYGGVDIYKLTSTGLEFKAQYSANPAVLADGANIAWNLASEQAAVVTLADNRTLDNPTNLKDGGTYRLIVKQDATGSRTLAYGSAYKWKGGTAPRYQQQQMQ